MLLLSIILTTAPINLPTQYHEAEPVITYCSEQPQTKKKRYKYRPKTFNNLRHWTKALTR